MTKDEQSLRDLWVIRVLKRDSKEGGAEKGRENGWKFPKFGPQNTNLQIQTPKRINRKKPSPRPSH